jgi:hypothetical protein
MQESGCLEISEDVRLARALVEGRDSVKCMVLFYKLW